jgi:hypothetical protein
MDKVKSALGMGGENKEAGAAGAQGDLPTSLKDKATAQAKEAVRPQVEKQMDAAKAKAVGSLGDPQR